jgi:hypothetical protein
MSDDHDRLCDLEDGVNECRRMARACLIIVEHHYEQALALRDTNLTPRAMVEALDESMEPLEMCIRQMVAMTADLHRKYYYGERAA